MHPKYLNAILNFFGFTPKLKSTFDRLGTRTQLWRIENKITAKEFAEILNIPKEEIQRMEQARHCTIDIQIESKINCFLKNRAFSSFTMLVSS